MSVEVRWVVGRLPPSPHRSSDTMGLGGRRRKGCREEPAAGGSEAAGRGSSWSALAGSCFEEMPGVEAGSPSGCSESLALADPGSVFGSVHWSPPRFSWNNSTQRNRLQLISRPQVFLCIF